MRRRFLAFYVALLACALPAAAQQPAAEQVQYDKLQGIYATIEVRETDLAIRRLGQLIPTPRREAIAAAVASAPPGCRRLCCTRSRTRSRRTMRA